MDVILAQLLPLRGRPPHWQAVLTWYILVTSTWIRQARSHSRGKKQASKQSFYDDLFFPIPSVRRLFVLWRWFQKGPRALGRQCFSWRAALLKWETDRENKDRLKHASKEKLMGQRFGFLFLLCGWLLLALLVPHLSSTHTWRLWSIVLASNHRFTIDFFFMLIQKARTLINI